MKTKDQKCRALVSSDWNGCLLHRLEWDVVLAALELEFSQDEAACQPDTAVRWGRYAVLLAYDDNTESIYLEPPVELPPET